MGRVNAVYPVDMDNEELSSLLTTIKNQGEELVQLTSEVNKLQAALKKAEGAKKTTAKKTAEGTEKKSAAKKTTKKEA